MLYESKNFRLHHDDDVLTLWLDLRGRDNHRLTLASLNELALVLDRAAALPAAPAVVLVRSSRPRAFLEEFDGEELQRLRTPLDFAALARRGQDVARKLAALSATTVALIEGRCVGVGLELALACDYRCALAEAATFACHDTERGLIPFCGGTYRLPRTIGVGKALQLLLDEQMWSAKQARSNGLVDWLLAPQAADSELVAIVDHLREAPAHWGRLIRRGWRSLLNGAVGKSVIRQRKRQLRREGRDVAQAELELLQALEAGLATMGEGLTRERAALMRLAECESSQRRLALHVTATRPPRVYPAALNPAPRPPRRVGVVGNGELARGLAAHLAGHGCEVVMHVAAEELATGWAMSDGSPLPIRATSDWIGFDHADLVIEAATEDPGELRNLFAMLEQHVRPRTILTSASTATTIDVIQAEAARPGRLAGLHFPNLTELHPLAEIVGTPATQPDTVTALAEWSRFWRFTPVLVGDRPGRLVQLVRAAYLAEAVTLVAQGLPIDDIDRALRRFGMTRGPLEWCDEIGLDNLARQTAQLQLSRGDEFARPLLFQRLLPYGLVGRALAEGFYRYGLSKRPSEFVRMALWQDVEEDDATPFMLHPNEALRDGIERVILRSVNEAAAALEGQPDADPATVDMALVLGMGWSAARGGPLHYADDLGLATVVERLLHFADRHGRRFEPCAELLRRAEAGESFYASEIRAPAPAKILYWRMAG